MGKAQRNRRDCPAAGRQISAAECGSGRGSLYQCPSTCPYSPFTPNNYDQLLAIESLLIKKTLAFMEKERARAGLKDSGLDYLRPGGSDSHSDIHSRIVWDFYWERNASGRTLAELWLLERNSDLKNDERVLLSFSSRVRPVLYQVHRLIDAQTTEGIDLITGEALRIVDRSAAASACRYDTVFGWMYPLPHFSRLSGSAVKFADTDGLEPGTVLREIASHLGAPPETEALIPWLAKHFSRVVDAMSAVAAARWEASVRKMDCQFVKTDYRIRNRAPLMKSLETNRNILPEDAQDEDLQEGFTDVFVCLVGEDTEEDQLLLSFPNKNELGMGRPVLGRILVGSDRVRLEANSSARHQSLKARFEKLARSFTEFVREHRTDLVEQILAGKSGKYDPALVPPKLLENPPEIAVSTDLLPDKPDGPQPTAEDAYTAMYKNFVDSPIPALDGLTPRSASQDPLMRPRLVRLMQTHIRNCDEKRREEGVDIDIDPLLRELGLDELISEPPPLGVKKRKTPGKDFGGHFISEEVDGDEDSGARLSRRRAHAPLKSLRHVLSLEEVDERIEAMFERYPTFQESAQAVDRIVPGVLDFAFDLLLEEVGEFAAGLSLILVSRACLVMAGNQRSGLELDFDEITRLLRADFNHLTKFPEKAEKLELSPVDDWISSSPQPNLALVLVELMMDMFGKVPKKQRVPMKHQFIIFAFLKSLIDGLSRALGETR